ncbi:DegV family protein [Mesoaciditoga lauensis]|uniref:DegV family protein n=1 Tax=Mesoaciditoga lauensis TaxID=1495039 RepID=UPI0005600392|nr:DegV family protein [Mesoaciditoga lauensis]
MIGIICDSGTDLPDEILEDKRVKMVPLKVILGDKIYKDRFEISEEEVLEFMKQGFPKSSLPNVDEVKNALMEMVKDGYNEIIGVNISSGLSGTHNVFKMASSDFLKEFSDIKIEIVDSLNISMGAGFLVYKALQLIDSGASFEEVVRGVKDSIKKSKLLYTIPTLKFLKAGGRIGKVSATMGEILNLKPVISVDDEGVYYTVAKARGMKKAVDKMTAALVRFAEGRKVLALSIYRSGNDPKTLELVKTVEESLKPLNAPVIFEKSTTPVLLVHVGDGLIGAGVLTE